MSTPPKPPTNPAPNPAPEPAPPEELRPALPDSYRAAILADATLPEPVRRALLSGLPLERITLDAEGRFWHEGDPIDNPRIAELFHRSIQRTPGGTYVLHIAPFTYPIEVKDTPYFVRRCELEDPGGPGEGTSVRLYLSDGSDELLVPTSLRYVAERGFYCAVKGGSFDARFSRPAYYALAEHIEEAGGGYVLVLGNTRTAIAGE